MSLDYLQSRVILAVETSCDETAVAVVSNSSIQSQRVRSNLVYSQIKEHKEYGGVVPEIASRAHLQFLGPLIQQALQESGHSLNNITDFAATLGPGLIGGLMVGATLLKTVALTQRKPFWGINHLEGHALTARLFQEVAFPYLLLLASGGHTQLIWVQGISRYSVLGQTLDDSVGEAFDKVAQRLGLGFGGAAVEKAARIGNPKRFSFSIPLRNRKTCDLSFSGLKNALRVLIEKEKKLDLMTQCDLAASFQETVCQTLLAKTGHAFAQVSPQRFVMAGGVAANQELRNRFQTECNRRGIQFIVPPISFCTDNAAMIGWCAIEKMQAGMTPTSLNEPCRPRWPLH
jgi:N6-L-threonylcarbamoyladenine synthase